MEEVSAPVPARVGPDKRLCGRLVVDDAATPVTVGGAAMQVVQIVQLVLGRHDAVICRRPRVVTSIADQRLLE